MTGDKRRGRDGRAWIEEGELQAGGSSEETGRGARGGAGAEDSHLWRSNHQL